MATAMDLSCGSKFAKCFLFLFNIVFWVVGAIVLGVGIWALVDDDVLQLLHVASVDTSDSLVHAASVTLVVVGAIIFVTGFLGCCGAARESPCMLLTYAFIVGLVLVLQVISGIMGAVFRDQIQNSLGTTMNKTVTELYGEDGRSTTTEAYDFMQVEFKCCGALNGPEDWLISKWFQQPKNETQYVPDSCCVLENHDYKNPLPLNRTMCNLAASNQTLDYADFYLHTQGCHSELLDWINGHASIIIGVAFGLAFIQIIGIVIACCLACNIKRLNYHYV